MRSSRLCGPQHLRALSDFCGTNGSVPACGTMKRVNELVEPVPRLVPAQPEHLPLLEDLMNLTIRPWVEMMFETWNQGMAHDSIQDDVVNGRASMVLLDERVAGLIAV